MIYISTNPVLQLVLLQRGLHGGGPVGQVTALAVDIHLLHRHISCGWKNVGNLFLATPVVIGTFGPALWIVPVLRGCKKRV